jgi:hypothetical protein
MSNRSAISRRSALELHRFFLIFLSRIEIDARVPFDYNSVELAKILKQNACKLRRNRLNDEPRGFDERARIIIYKDIKDRRQAIRGKVLSKPEPVYPVTAKKLRIDVKLLVEVIFD